MKITTTMNFCREIEAGYFFHETKKDFDLRMIKMIIRAAMYYPEDAQKSPKLFSTLKLEHVIILPLWGRNSPKKHCKIAIKQSKLP